MTNASLAALAALAIHNKNNQTNDTSRPYNPSPQAYQASGRANSLAGNHRSNSMRSYTYNPKPSYQAGPLANRSYSLRSNSLRGSAPPARSASLQQRLSASQRVSSLTNRTPSFPRTNSLTSSPLSHRAGSLTGATRGLGLAHQGVSEEDENFDEEDVIVTTKTTKVLDSMGRTCSITTETIKTLPDGSNIVETTTRNISRSGSRSNSLRNNSMTMAHANPSYNLNKIDEDLQDFDYTYLDHPPSQLPKLNMDDRAPPHQQVQPQAALGPAFDPPRRTSDTAPPVNPGKERNEDSVSSSASPRLKSILKHSPAPPPQSSLPQHADSSLPKGNRNLGEEAIHRPLHEDPNHHKTAVASNASAGNSIKFLDTVETIPYEANSHNLAEVTRAEALKQEKEKQENISMYEQAMKVAMERVYGTPREESLFLTPPDSPQTKTLESPQANLDKLVDKKLKHDHKRGKDEGGVSKNYVYENHHKEFAIHSLRGEEEPGHSSRKERAKEEKKQQKEEEKKRQDLLKLAEKERKKEESEQKKQKRGAKNPLSFLSLKMRRGSSGSATSSSYGGIHEKRDSHPEPDLFEDSHPTQSSERVHQQQTVVGHQDGTRDAQSSGSKDHQQIEQQTIETPTQAQGNAIQSPTAPVQTFVGDVVAPKEPLRPAAITDVNDITVPPRSPLRNADTTERHMRSLSEGSNMTEFLNKETVNQPPPISTQITGEEEHFHDSNDFIDVPEYYGAEEPAYAENVVPETMNEPATPKVAQTSGSSDVKKVAPVVSPSAVKVNSTEPLPTSIDVPERPSTEVQEDTTLVTPSQTEKQGPGSQELPTLVSGENGHPVVLGQQGNSDKAYPTLDPGSPSSKKMESAAVDDAVDTATIPSDKSAVSVPAPSSEYKSDDVMPTSVGAMDTTHATETQNVADTDTDKQATGDNETPATDVVTPAVVVNDSENIQEINAANVSDVNSAVPNITATNPDAECAADRIEQEQPSQSSGDMTEVSVPSQQEKYTKPKTKKGLKFKRMIDKYFISPHNR